ncbi:MAG TPA: tRNA epoxyqueuosine(34) reductase QueG [Thermoanaerobaculia bacterium]|nr:tRNA epoxyqueuosine(34) reductase QueG [Thermoanaerobaculia bacterium]
MLAKGPPDRLLAARVLREEAENAGFTRFGIARAGAAPRFDRFERWIAAGFHAGMRYLEDTLPERRSPGRLLSGARSVVCLAAPYSAEPHVAPDGSRYARYARGADYHGCLRERACRVADRSRARLPGDWASRVCVDSTPLAERAFAAAAGLGWIGKNGCLIDPEQGSYLLLAEIVTDLDLPADDPAAEQCGACVRCLDACPTGALRAPAVLDASRCIAYWTIEHSGPVPDAWKEAAGDHVFGCDVCQEVCPWNAPLAARAALSPPGAEAPTRAQVLAMGKGAWRRRFGKTAVNRAARRGLQRNAALSAGARGDRACLPELRAAAQVREAGLSDAARWALEKLSPHPL